MAIVIKKNTVDVSSSIDPNSVVLLLVLTKEVSTLEFSVKNYGSKTTVSLGDTIDIYEDAVHIFGGTVVEKKDAIAVNGGILRQTRYTANDWSFKLNSKLVVQTYVNQDPQTIIQNIIANFTDGTYTTTHVQLAGFTIPTIQFNYESVTVALQKIAKTIGWEWYVDPDKDVHFFPPDSVSTAPYDIDDTSGNLEWPTLEIQQSIVNLKNSIYVVGGTYTKNYTALTTTDVYTTDGVRSVFPIAYAYATTGMVVSLDAVSQTIGTDQVTDPASVQVLYNQLDRFVRFTSVPAIGKTVKIYGDAQIPILASARNSTSILAYGEIQDIIVDQQITSIGEAHDRANAQIDQYGAVVYSVHFATVKTGFIVGQTVRVNSAIFGLDIYVVIKRIIGRPYGPNQFRYEIDAVGTDLVNFVDIMKYLMVQATTQNNVSSSSVLESLLILDETITFTDTLNAPTSSTGPYKWGASASQGQWNFFTWG